MHRDVGGRTAACGVLRAGLDAVRGAGALLAYASGERGRRVLVFRECVVCGNKTHETVTLIRTLENVPICRERCRRIFLQYPWIFLEAEEPVSSDAAR